MRLISLSQIKPIIEDKQAILEAVKQGFVQHAQGKISLPDPIQMLFAPSSGAIAGDCHVKTASSEELPYFSIKIATGFYQNPEKGLPVNNGLVMLISCETGEPLALLEDEGHLTSIRTAAAGALAASLRQQDVPRTLGIVGTGHQAQLQARWICKTNSISTVFVWGRSRSKMDALKSELEDLDVTIETTPSISKLCEESRIVVTTTPSQTPLMSAGDLKPGHHIISVGSDSPGKIELEPEVLKQADVIMTDDHAQCLHHGEFGWAVRAGLIEESKDLSFGKVLQDPSILNMANEGISVVDLTGLGAQDLAIASMVYDRTEAH